MLAQSGGTKQSSTSGVRIAVACLGWFAYYPDRFLERVPLPKWAASASCITYFETLGVRAVSSIRPLFTITVLAAVGVFLYMKINETEPPLPEGVEDWSASTDVQFDMGGTAAAEGPQFGMAPAGNAPAADHAPAFAAPPSAGETAPAFEPNAATAPAAAPPFNNPPAIQSAPPAQVTGNEVSGNEVASTAPGLPDLPPLPTLPPAPSTAPSVAGTPPVDSSDLDAIARAEIAAQAQAAPRVGGVALNAPAETQPITPTPTDTAQAQSSVYSATRTAVQAALDRGELSQALLLLSDWYGDPSLSPSETEEVNTLLSQLAGSVIYSTEHRLEPPYMVQAGERLETIAKKYEVPWQLLAKINGITSADQLQPGQELKVVRGPFSALIDITRRQMTLMLDRRYAGRFSLDIDPAVTVEAGQWEVNQKLLTPAGASPAGTSPTMPTEARSLLLASASGTARTGSHPTRCRAGEPADRTRGPRHANELHRRGRCF